MRTQSYAVNSAATTFFWAATDMSWAKRPGTGQPRRRRAASPDARRSTYASLQGEPMLLTKNEAGALLLPLSQGAAAQLQHRQSFSRSVGIGVSTLWLPSYHRPPRRPASSCRYDRDWLPLYEELSPEVRFPAVSVGELIVLLLLLLGAERLLSHWVCRRGCGSALRFCFARLPRRCRRFWCCLSGRAVGRRAVFRFAVAVRSKAAVLAGGRRRLVWADCGRCCSAVFCLAGVRRIGLRWRRSRARCRTAANWPQMRVAAAQLKSPNRRSIRGSPRETIPWGEHRSYLHRERLLKAKAARCKR